MFYEVINYQINQQRMKEKHECKIILQVPAYEFYLCSNILKIIINLTVNRTFFTAVNYNLRLPFKHEKIYLDVSSVKSISLFMFFLIHF